jgi:hypothetical protein
VHGFEAGITSLNIMPPEQASSKWVNDEKETRSQWEPRVCLGGFFRG